MNSLGVILFSLVTLCLACEEPNPLDDEIQEIRSPSSAEYQPSHTDSLVLRAFELGRRKGYSEYICVQY